MMTGSTVDGMTVRSCLQNSWPLMCGIMQSSRMRSGRVSDWDSQSRACRPSMALGGGGRTQGGREGGGGVMKPAG